MHGAALRFRRPNDYNPQQAALLGPTGPSPHLNLAAVGLTPGSTVRVHGSFPSNYQIPNHHPINDRSPPSLPIQARLAALQAAGVNVQATRHARRVYVGGFPDSTNEPELGEFVGNALEAVRSS